MKIVVLLSAIISMVVVAPMMYMIADTLPPYEYDVDKSYVVPEKTLSGRQMLVHWEFKRVNRVCAGTITRYIVDQQTGARISYDPYPAANEVEASKLFLDRTFFLPPEIAPGPKWYYADGDFACNPLQYFYPMRVRTPRLPFVVQGG